jgi:ABC-type Mn2+/Zn2+ transport system permease subunit
VAALQTVGAFLVICLVVTPGATAWLLTDRFPRLLAIAVAIGSLTSFFGAWLSYYLDGATGGIIVVAQTLLFLLTFVFAPNTACWPTAVAPGRAHAADHASRTVPVFVYGQRHAGGHHRRHSLRAAVGFSGAERLGVDGRCHEPCGLSRRGGGLYLGIPFAIGAFVAGLFCAIATGYLDDNSRIKRDTIMGIVFSGMFGAGLVLYVAIQSEVHLDHILFGDMLGISASDIGQTSAIALVIALIIGLKWRDFLLHAFDPHQAKASGLRCGLLHYGLLCMIALTIVATLKAVGIILSISLLIAPGAIALLLTRRFISALLLAVAIA